MSRIAEGVYKGRGIKGSEQYGTTSNGNDQIVINLDLQGVGEVSTFLVFTERAASWSMRRLRALGWQGDDLSDLSGIDSNEVDVEVRYEDYNGEAKMKVEIVVGGGTVALKNQFDDKGKKAFAAKYKTLAKTTPVQKPAPSASDAFAPTGTDSGDGIPF